METYFYAHLIDKKGVEKKIRFTNRDEARDYISKEMTTGEYVSCWTD